MDKTKVFFSISNLKIMTAKHVLSEAGIESFTINKMDSMHPGVFDGKIELYVDIEVQDKARNVLIENELLDEQ